MKKMRKGFTLVELLIVIGIISILGTMALIGGTEANNIAQANKIIEEFRTIGAAMNMYYADNRSEAVTADADKIKKGIEPYMKNTDSVEVVAASGTAKAGMYSISVVNGSEWWLTYTLPADDSKVGLILKNKAKSESLKTATDGTTDYAGGGSVCLQIR